MTKKHAMLSASGAARWINCPPSLALEQQFPESTSEFAAEGTLAHEIAELKLKKHFTPIGPRAFTTQMNKLKKHELYQEEMQGYTDTYLDYIKELTHGLPSVPYCVIEKRVDFGEYAPGGFGTADCIVVHGETLWIVDFKYGKGVEVSAERNPQMMLYALGALNAYSLIYGIKRVKMVICQPRINNLSEWELWAEDLYAWGREIVKPRAELALEGGGEYAAGTHCRFCRAKATCRNLAEHNLKLARFEFKDPGLLNNEEIAAAITDGEMLVNWLKSLEEYALAAMLEGEEIPGYKVVEGRSNRTFIDQDRAFDKLISAGISEAILYERRPITLTAAEKIVGKKQFDELLADDIEKPRGKPTLAAQSDKREPYSITSAQQDFKEAI